MELLFAFSLFLTPPAYETGAPATVKFPAVETARLHLRWKSLAGGGAWALPGPTLAQPGQYWISAATKPRVKRYSPAEYEAHAARYALDLVSEYRKKYKLTAQPTRLLESTYAKTTIRVGGKREDTSALLLHLPIELVLRYPTLLQLNFRGQPLAGIPVMVNGKRQGLTNGAGQLPIAGLDGKLEISASVIRAYPDHTTADWEVFTATLTLPELALR